MRAASPGISSGFTLADFLISLFLFTVVLMGTLNLVAVNLLNLRLTKNQRELENVAVSQLLDLVASTRCDPLDPLLEVCVDPDCIPKYKEISWEGKSVTCEWKTYEETVTSNEQVKTYRLEMYTYFTNQPLKTRAHVATKICYVQ